MDFTIMIIARIGDGTTSQLKSFPTRREAENVVDIILREARTLTARLEILRLYS